MRYKMQTFNCIMWSEDLQHFAFVRTAEERNELLGKTYRVLLRNVSFEYANAITMFIEDIKMKSENKYTHEELCLWVEEFQYIHHIFNIHEFLKDEHTNIRKHTTTIYS